MIQPQELEVWYILPAIRRDLAVCLKQEGLLQRQVAKLLGVTEAAISQYLKSKRAKKIQFDGNIKKEIKKSVKKIKNNKACATAEIQRICNLIKKKGILCAIHKKYENVCKMCKICLK